MKIKFNNDFRIPFQNDIFFNNIFNFRVQAIGIEHHSTDYWIDINVIIDTFQKPYHKYGKIDFCLPFDFYHHYIEILIGNIKEKYKL